MRHPLPLAALLVAVLLTLAGCGNGADTAGGGDGFNEADADFASDMIQHHAQALLMVDASMGRRLDPEVAELADEIRAAQAPEIERMADWLKDWDRPVPETVRDHANAHGDGMDMDTDMPGMASAEEMQSLRDAGGGEFQEMWLRMMIAHHEGAVEMAQTEQTEGRHPGAVALAEDIESAQQAEIARMRELLDS